ncbi:alcohol dehydrogenase-like protein [Rhizodiscina lignyota]|uniref:Alcohol dehydrogenase-like protein n=1 Tax=Rhizodiscina lignyota TaxID=1504668 RepID=A0A9P4ME89_9PEZI|nr:alcohol dehydrogenase-like protein [Rhizodiscina lignyota]
MAATEEPPRIMKAQFLDAFNQPYNFRETEVPTCSSPYDILIKVDAASYCHTDAVLAAGLMPPNPASFPHVGCHEFAGRVVYLPSNASETAKQFPPGTRLGVPGRAFHPCGACAECLDESTPYSDAAGYSVYCPKSANNGVSGPGGFREYAVVDARQVAPIPQGLDCVDVAPLMCAGVTIYSALIKCNLKPGQSVGISGCGGGLGHLGLQFATKMGLKVFGIDAADKPLELAMSLNTGSKLIDARTEDPESVVQELGREMGKTERSEMGLDAVIILPESQQAFDYAVKLLRNRGKCIVVSFPEKGFNISSRDIVFRQISFEGSLVGSNRLLREMLKFAAEHQVKAVKRTYPLAKLNELVEDYHKGAGGKLVIDMS